MSKYDKVLDDILSGKIDIQPDKKDHSKAKAYQIRQIRNFIKEYLEV